MFSKKSNKSWLENSLKNINERDKDGRTILHHAVEISDVETVRLLIEKVL